MFGPLAFALPDRPAFAFVRRSEGISMAARLWLTRGARLVRLQREWGQQFKDKGKVVDWPKHCFEHFLIVVRARSPGPKPFP